MPLNSLCRRKLSNHGMYLYVVSFSRILSYKMFIDILRYEICMTVSHVTPSSGHSYNMYSVNLT